MNNLLSLLLGSLTQQSSVEAASKKSGISARTVLTILSYALPLIMKAMTKNASSQTGAQSLLGALTQHTSKRSVAEQIADADTADGTKIINHIFGNDTKSILGQIAGQTGTDADAVGKVLSAIAPSLLSSISAATSTANQIQTNNKKGIDLSDGLDAGELISLFGNANTFSSLASMFGAKPAQTQTAADDGTALLSSLLGLMGK